MRSSDGSLALIARTMFFSLTATLVSVALVAVLRIYRYPQRYNYCFHSDRTRRHTVSGCLLTLVLCMPILAGYMKHSWVIALATFYSFVFVPVVSGLYSLQPLWLLTCQKARLFRLYLSTRLVVGLYNVRATASVAKEAYHSLIKLQTLTNQLVFATFLVAPWLGGHQWCGLHLLFLLTSANNAYATLSCKRASSPIGRTSVSGCKGLVSVTCCIVLISYWWSGHAPSVLAIFVTTFYCTVTEVAAITDNDCNNGEMTESRMYTWLKADLILGDLGDLLLPCIASGLSVAISGILIIIWGLGNPPTSCWPLLIASMYTNIYAPVERVLNDQVPTLQVEMEALKAYRRPDSVEFRARSDEGQCPICLQLMRICRITPCGHIFHWHCLRKALRYGHMGCPICRHALGSK